jgi:Thioredoxin-like domain/Tetratricopeptide repeat
VKEQSEAFERFGVQWTPTILLLDPSGTERYRFEGYLPVPDFLAQLRLGLAHEARALGDWSKAESLYRELADDPAAGEVAPEALYWAGVSKYKATGEAGALGDTAQAFKTRFTDSTWAKKASVWAG